MFLFVIQNHEPPEPDTQVTSGGQRQEESDRGTDSFFFSSTKLMILQIIACQPGVAVS